MVSFSASAEKGMWAAMVAHCEVRPTSISSLSFLMKISKWSMLLSSLYERPYLSSGASTVQCSFRVMSVALSETVSALTSSFIGFGATLRLSFNSSLPTNTSASPFTRKATRCIFPPLSLSKLMVFSAQPVAVASTAYSCHAPFTFKSNATVALPATRFKATRATGCAPSVTSVLYSTTSTPVLPALPFKLRQVPPT